VTSYQTMRWPYVPIFEQGSVHEMAGVTGYRSYLIDPSDCGLALYRL